MKKGNYHKRNKSNIRRKKDKLLKWSISIIVKMTNNPNNMTYSSNLSNNKTNKLIIFKVNNRLRDHQYQNHP